MSERADLLVEIGTEELPPKALAGLSAAFTAGLGAALAAQAFAFDGVRGYATPRRLAVMVAQLAGTQPARTEQRRGPAVAAAYDASGQPTKAASGFARSCGVEVAALTRLVTADGEWLACERHLPGRSLAAALPALVEQALAALPIPKRMRWGARTVEFVRPVHWVVLLHGDTLVPGTVLDTPAGRITRGHRFHHPEPITLAQAADYEAALAAPGHVIADFATRRARVRELVETSAAAAGGSAVLDPALLDEVTALVEWPVAVTGEFDAHFLALPPEILIASMQDHQKYFAVRTTDGRLSNRFITLANLASRDPRAVQAGNERVIRPRLADADFFYRSDRAEPLAARAPRLADMLFEKRLGTLADKSARVERLARTLAPTFAADGALAARAALLARCDLLSSMVGEFPELQGTVGSYYAAADGEDAAVAAAIGEFYRPRYAGDDIPATTVGRCVAFADKLDSLVGIFGIGSAPTGDKDPYALRRAAIGALRILIEGRVDLDLDLAIALALAEQRAALAPDTAQQVATFMRERMRGYYLERGVEADVCAAVLAKGLGAPLEIERRLHAVGLFRAAPAARALAAANKRTANILRKHAGPIADAIAHDCLVEPAERALAAALADTGERAGALFADGRYADYMACLAELRTPVDAFFDQVMVMADDPRLRDNRLALLSRLHGLFTRVADLSLLHDA